MFRKRRYVCRHLFILQKQRVEVYLLAAAYCSFPALGTVTARIFCVHCNCDSDIRRVAQPTSGIAPQEKYSNDFPFLFFQSPFLFSLFFISICFFISLYVTSLVSFLISFYIIPLICPSSFIYFYHTSCKIYCVVVKPK